MLSPNNYNHYNDQKCNSGNDSNTIDYFEYKRRKRIRKAYLKRQRQLAFRRFVLFCTCLVVFFIAFVNISYKYFYLPIVNSGYEIKVDNNFFNSTEAMLTTNSFFGHKHLLTGSVNPDSYLMASMPLGRELNGLKAQLLPLAYSNKNYRVGLFIWDAQTHNYVSMRGNEAFKTASIIKIPVLIELFRHIDKGLTSISKEVPFKGYQLAAGSGSLQYQPVGNTYSLDYLAKIMIQHSDNTATNILLDEVGGSEALNDVMDQWGIQNGHMENWLPDLTGTNYMSPKDYATMLYNIGNTSFLSESSRDKSIDYMSNIKHRNFIKDGIPAGSSIAHKTGDIGEMVGDAGIVTLPCGKKYIIVAMVERPWNSYRAKEIIKEASRITFNYFTR
ncbi:MAG: serine hydrolase [Vampirovibrionia bacterium]